MEHFLKDNRADYCANFLDLILCFCEMLGVGAFKLYDYIIVMKQQMLGSSMRLDSTVFEKVISCHPRYVQSLDSEGLKFGISSSISILNLEICNWLS